MKKILHFLILITLPFYLFSQTDCVLTSATDITSILNNSTTNFHLWDCDPSPRIFPSTSTPTILTTGDVIGECDGTTTTNRNDVWLTFTVDATNKNTWLDVYSAPGTGIDMVTALYSGTPTIASTCSTVDGLTYVGCADGDGGLLGLFGGTNIDAGLCTTPLHERLNISGLANGTYYLRIWKFGGGAPTTDAEFYICAESNTPIAPAVDQCDQFPVFGDPTIGCLEDPIIPNRDVVINYPDQSNVGATGYSLLDPLFCDIDNGLVGVGGVLTGRADYNCDGNFVTPLYLNNVTNNNVFYSFRVAGSLGCNLGAYVSLKFDNLSICCGESNIQVQVSYGDCLNGYGGLAASADIAAGETCFILEPNGTANPSGGAGGFLPNGLYFISVEGQNGALVEYDLELTVDYDNLLFACTDNGNCGDAVPPVDPVPDNDCVLNATSITKKINTFGSCFDCEKYVYHDLNAEGPSTSDVIISGSEHFPVCGTTTQDHYDTWYTFTVSNTTPDTWLDIYSDESGNLDMVVALYSGTPIVASGDCNNPADPEQITGLIFEDCSNGSDNGGVRDVAECTTPVVARLDLSGLANGTYYLRVFEWGGGTPSEGLINMCIEENMPYGAALDFCPSGGNTVTTIGCGDADITNKPYTITYAGQCNAGTVGNACPILDPRAGESELVVTPVYQPATSLDIGCNGAYSTSIIYNNNVTNNTAYYPFVLDSQRPNPTLANLDDCYPVLHITLDNVMIEGSIGDQAQVLLYGDPLFQGTPGACDDITEALAGFNMTEGNGCYTFRPTDLFNLGGFTGTFQQGAIPDGYYYLVVEGLNGALISYDITIDVDYVGPNCNPDPVTQICGSTLAIELMNFNGTNKGHTNELTWSTASEINNERFEIQRAEDGINFVTIGSVNGAINSSIQNDYEFIDNTPLPSAYYRLKIIDSEGNNEYSEPILIKTNNHNSLIKTSYPNPVVDVLTIDLYNQGKSQEVEVRILDVTGKLLSSLKESIVNNQFEIDLSNYSSGIYFIETSTLNTTESIKIIKH